MNNEIEYKCEQCKTLTQSPIMFLNNDSMKDKVLLCPLCSGKVHLVNIEESSEPSLFNFSIEDIRKNEDVNKAFRKDAVFNRIMVTFIQNKVTKEDIINIIKDLCNTNKSLAEEIVDLKSRSTSKLF